MSRVSSTAKRYTGPSYTSHYGSYSSSLTPSLGTYDRDKLSYKAPSTTYSTSGYLSSSSSRTRNFSSSEPERGRPIPRTDLLSGRRSESLSRTPLKGYSSGLNGGSAYSAYGYSPAQTSYLSTSPMSSSVSLNRRKSVSQSDLTRELSSLALSDASSSSSSSSLKQAYRSRASDATESYNSSSLRSGFGMSRSSTQEALISSSSRFSTARSSSPLREEPGRRPVSIPALSVSHQWFFPVGDGLCFMHLSSIKGPCCKDTDLPCRFRHYFLSGCKTIKSTCHFWMLISVFLFCWIFKQWPFKTGSDVFFVHLRPVITTHRFNATVVSPHCVMC